MSGRCRHTQSITVARKQLELAATAGTTDDRMHVNAKMLARSPVFQQDQYARLTVRGLIKPFP